MKTIITNWKTLIGGLIAMSGVIGLMLHKIDLATATTLIGTGATWVGIVGKDGDQGSTKESPRVDAAVEKVEHL